MDADFALTVYAHGGPEVDYFRHPSVAIPRDGAGSLVLCGRAQASGSFWELVCPSVQGTGAVGGRAKRLRLAQGLICFWTMLLVALMMLCFDQQAAGSSIATYENGALVVSVCHRVVCWCSLAARMKALLVAS